MTSETLYKLGIRLMDDALVCGKPPTSWRVQTGFRDGLIIALLALIPLRRRTLSALRIGKQLIKSGDAWSHDIPAQDVKTNRPLDYPISPELSQRIDIYLNEIRPQIAGAGTHDYLWASSRGGPLRGPLIYNAVRKRTRKALGFPGAAARADAADRRADGRARASWLAAFGDVLAKLGWREGNNIRMELRWGAANPDRMRTFAKELVDRQPDAIFSQTTPAISITCARDANDSDCVRVGLRSDRQRLSLNMRRIPMRSIPVRWSLLGAVLIAIVVYGGAGLVRTVCASGAGHDHTVFSAQLPNVPGKTLTAIVVEYGPGGSSPAHRHAGSAFAYVLSGQIRSENSATGPVRVYRAGETFFEPPGSTHLVSANASDTEPASLLAVFVADDNAQLTQPAH